MTKPGQHDKCRECERVLGKFPLDAETPVQGILGKIRITFGLPFIYGIVIPMVLFDLCLEIYHRTCFTIFAIPKVKRSKYFIFDRHKLPYLTNFEKLNCLYCSYFNNLMAYAQEIGARTERHWCPVKHAVRRMHEHDHYQKFFEYNQEQGFQREKKLLRVYDPDAPEQSSETRPHTPPES